MYRFAWKLGAVAIVVFLSTSCGGRSVGGGGDGGMDAAVPDGHLDVTAVLDGHSESIPPDVRAEDGGLVPPAPECRDPSECRLHSDCCQCVALAPNEPEPNCAILECYQDVCAQLEIKEPKCLAGHCSAGANCDDSQVLCDSPTPVCEPGWVPSVRGACWGPCVPASECAYVNSCAQCDPRFYLCVTYTGRTETHHCVEVPEACRDDRNCTCMGRSSCVSPFDVCKDGQSNEIQCECPTCD